MDSLSVDFLELARALTGAELYSKAYEVFLVAIARNPSLAGDHKCEVRKILNHLNSELALCGRIEDIFANFEKALGIYPDYDCLVNDIGSYLFRFGFYKEAWLHFERVLYINSCHVMAEKNLNCVKNLLVHRWHFRMLNDGIRNEAYRRAIQEELILPLEEKVIDVGTGTGLLAIYAFEAGATDIVACDDSETMIELADKILQKNGLRLDNDVKLIKKMSTAMDSEDLNGKATLLLTETFDAGLFGEHVLQMLQHAWQNLLSDSARIIPNSAEFFVVGAQCNHLNTKYQLSSAAKKLLNLENECIHILEPDETYDCEDVHLQRDIKYLTESQSVLTINFNDLKEIEMHLNRTQPYEVDLNVVENGVVNIIVGWFNLYLTKGHTITTDPRSASRANAWQQTVFFDELPRTVEKGESFKLEFLMNGGRFTLKSSSDANITRVSPDIVRFLNDEEYMQLIINSISVASVYLCQIVDMSEIRIVDLSPFPLFGMLMMQRGASSLRCYTRSEHDKQFIIDVFKKNSVPLTNVTILLDSEWVAEDLRDEMYHVVFSHILELGGDFDGRLKTIAMDLQKQNLHSFGLYMPANMWIVAQLVSSHWLDISNTLYDASVSRYRMSEFVNKYRVNVNYYVDFSTLKYVPLSRPVEICKYPEGTLYKDVQIINNGRANGILCFFKIELLKDMKIISTNRPNSFMDGMLFMTRTKYSVYHGLTVRLACYRDDDKDLKLDLLGVSNM